MNIGSMYAYAAARLHSIENKMLDRNALERLSDASGLDEAQRLLADFGYKSESYGFSAIEKVLSEALAESLSLAAKITDSPEHFRHFYLKADYYNLKVLLKAEMLGADFSHLLNGNGIYPVSELSEYLRERDFRKLSVIMGEAITEVIEATGKTGDPQMVDLILDRAYYAEALSNAKALGSVFLESYIRRQIDLVNIRSYFRVRKLGYGNDFLAKVLIPGGNAGVAEILALSDSSPDKLIKAFGDPDYIKAIEAGASAVINDEPLKELEKKLDEIIINEIRRYRHSPFGIEPAIAHVAAKENEIRNIRIILSGVMNGLGRDEIKESLRIAYV